MYTAIKKKLVEKKIGNTTGMAPGSKRIQLVVEIMSCRDLLIGDKNGWSDPYVKVKMGKKDLHRTDYITKTLNPVFSESTKSTFILVCTDKELLNEGGLLLKIKDWDLGASNDDLGTVVIPASEFLESPSQEGKEYPIKAPSGGTKYVPGATDGGFIKIRYRPATDSELAVGQGFFSRTTELLGNTLKKNPSFRYNPETREKFEPLDIIPANKDIFIEIVSCRDILASDKVCLSNPYVKVKLGTKDVHETTKESLKTLNPSFASEQNNSFTFSDIKGLFITGSLTFKIKDYTQNLVKGNDELGYAQIPALKLYHLEGEHEFPISPPQGRADDAGFITIRVGNPNNDGAKKDDKEKLQKDSTLGPPGEEGFNEINEAIEKSEGRIIWTFWDKGAEHFNQNRNFEKTIIERNWKAIHGDQWKIFCLDSVPGSKWNANDILVYAKKQGLIDFDLMTIDQLRAKNIGDIEKTPQYFSDMVRLALLEAFGGSWVDATLIMTDSLDNMFFAQMQAQERKTIAGFSLSMHGSRNNGYFDALENWFIMAKKGSEPLREWRKNTWRYIDDSPCRRENDDFISVWDRPIFNVDPSNTDPDHERVITDLRASMRKITGSWAHYLWGYCVWRRAVIEYPEFQEECLFREAGAERYGPVGHEHLLDHIRNTDRGGESAMFEDNRKKIAARASLKAKGDPLYASFMALKFPSVISAFRRYKDEDGNLKYTEERYVTDSLISDLTQAGQISAAKAPVFLEEGSLLRDSLAAKRLIMAGKYGDMPGGASFRFGYALLLYKKSIEEAREANEECKEQLNEKHFETVSEADKKQILRESMIDINNQVPKESWKIFTSPKNFLKSVDEFEAPILSSFYRGPGTKKSN
mmetsp:Transcript_27422/g.41740  ORF Transcript_27422/g.41740 Transcript_27422/m.41740 type:complete len:868 (-) Transcript_27422:89-2692(-)